MKNMSTTLSLHDISKSFIIHNKKIDVINHLSFSFDKKYTYAIIGKSGAGKSTLFHMIGGLIKPDDGTITIDGKNIDNSMVGMIFQQPLFIPELTVIENSMLPLFIKTKNKEMAYLHAQEIIDHVGLAHLMNYPIKALSGGEQQKASIARALSYDPDFLVADEPTSSLDQESAMHVVEILKKAHKEKNIGIILCTHIPEVAAAMDYTIVLKEGVLELQ